MEGDPCGEIGRFYILPTPHVNISGTKLIKIPAHRLESHLRPVYSGRAFDQVRDVPWLRLHFSGVETNSEGLMRFVMNPTLRQRYPEDDEFGKKWLEEGRGME